MTAYGDDDFDWQAWRREVRRDRISAREALDSHDREERDRAIDGWLRTGFTAVEGLTVAFCWPLRGEPDVRDAIRRWRDAGSTPALPVVLKGRTPLVFRTWWPGARTAPGVFGIPYPVDTPEVTPQVLLVPAVGFDREGYRLGYGGGHFDRTLAIAQPRPVTIGLAHEVARIKTIHPRSHDIPFDFFVTERGIEARIEGHLQRLEPDEANERLRALLKERGLAS